MPEPGGFSGFDGYSAAAFGCPAMGDEELDAEAVRSLRKGRV